MRRRYYARPMLLVVDVGNTQTHFGTYQGDELVEHWRFATVRTSTADELGAALRNLLELRGIGLADLTRRSSRDRPAARPEWQAMAERYLGHEMLVVGPGHADRDGHPLRQPARDRPRPARQRGRRLRPRAARCCVVDFGTAHDLRPVSDDGEYLGGIIAPGVEISHGGADRARRRAAAHRPRRRRGR